LRTQSPITFIQKAFFMFLSALNNESVSYSIPISIVQFYYFYPFAYLYVVLWAGLEKCKFPGNLQVKSQDLHVIPNGLPGFQVAKWLRHDFYDVIWFMTKYGLLWQCAHCPNKIRMTRNLVLGLWHFVNIPPKYFLSFHWRCGGEWC